MKFNATFSGRKNPIVVSGRTAWALQQLMTAGLRGISTVDQPAPRWSGYVEKLRKKGVLIDTVIERHGGQFSGRHVRYILRSAVTVEACK